MRVVGKAFFPGHSLFAGHGLFLALLASFLAFLTLSSGASGIAGTESWSGASASWKMRVDEIPPVLLEPGDNMYIVVRVVDERSIDGARTFVRSKKEVDEHYLVSVEIVDQLTGECGFPLQDVDVTGGGQIDLNSTEKTIKVYGESPQYGRGPHKHVARMIEETDLYRDYQVTYSFDS